MNLNNYTTPHCILGMLSKRYKPFPYYSGYIKNRKEVVIFDPSKIPQYLDYPKINLAYVDKMDKNTLNSLIPDYKNTSGYKGTLLYSNFEQDFFKLQGKSHREMRETRNHYQKSSIQVRNSASIEDITKFIQEWNTQRGDARYGWTLHSGYDLNFFTKHWENEKDKFQALFFYDNDKLIGYSVMSLDNVDNVYYYMLRKNLTSYRNLALYIDFTTFDTLYSNIGVNFITCWGANSGSLLKYKMKFPVFHTQEKWFYKFKREEVKENNNEQCTI